VTSNPDSLKRAASSRRITLVSCEKKIRKRTPTLIDSLKKALLSLLNPEILTKSETREKARRAEALNVLSILRKGALRICC
jgi:hypothetical protein